MTETRKRRGRGSKSAIVSKGSVEPSEITDTAETVTKAPMSVAEGLAASQEAKQAEREQKLAEAKEMYGQPPPKKVIETLGLPEDWCPTVGEDGHVYLDGIDLHEHQSIIHKGKHMREIAKRIRLEKELMSLKHQMHQASLDNQMNAALAKADEVEKEIIPSLHSKWTKKYGIDFRKVALDTETGKLLLEDGAKVER